MPLNNLVLFSTSQKPASKFYEEALSGNLPVSCLKSVSEYVCETRPAKGTVFVFDLAFALSEVALYGKLMEFREDFGSDYPITFLALPENIEPSLLAKIIEASSIVLPQGVAFDSFGLKELEDLVIAVEKAEEARLKVAMRKALHTLAQPLTAMSIYTSLLARSLTGKEAERLSEINKSVEEMIRMHNSLKQSSRQE